MHLLAPVAFCVVDFFKKKKRHMMIFVVYLISALNLEIIIMSQSLHKTNPAAPTQPGYTC